MNYERKPEQTLSVITPAYNAAAFIERCVRSVAAQTVAVREHIVVDDGSIDGTAEIIARLQIEYPHLVYLQQSQKGSGLARNRGIAQALGRYIAFLDSDDWWQPGKVEHQVAFMQRTGALFTYGDYEKRDAESGALLACYDTPPTLSYEDLLRSCPIGCLTAAYDQEILGKRYMPAVCRGQDWGLWLELTRDGTRAYKYPGNHAIYRKHRRSLSGAKLQKAIDMYRIYYAKERLGVLRSLGYLQRHLIYVLGKP